MANDTVRPSLAGRVLQRIGAHLVAAQAAENRALRQELSALRELTRQIAERVDHVRDTQKQLDKVLENQKLDEKFRMIFRRQLASLIRAAYLRSEIPAPLALQARRFRLRSQNEEDGIILALLEAIGVSSRRFVEIGCGGTGGNSAVLALDMGWSGLMVDGSRRAVRVARHEFRPNPGVTIVELMVTPENVNAMLQQHGYGGEVDLLSIDIDSTDYWILEALEVSTARVLVLEYNAHFGPSRAVTLPKERLEGNRRTLPVEYFGASLAALEKVARRKGYRLVLCEPSGINAFFVRDDIANGLHGLSPEQAYRPFRHRLRDDQELRSSDAVLASLSAAGLPLVAV
jgi:hypothetical protein